MKQIDDYIDNIYKDFDENEKEVQDLKEEMKVHLYDKVDEYKALGFSEQESIEKSINSSGEVKDVVGELEVIISKQNKFIKVIWKVALGIFIIAVFSLIGSYYYEHLTYQDWEKNRPISADVIVGKIMNEIKSKKDITTVDKNNFNKLLKDFNSKNKYGLYYLTIKKSNKLFYEYGLTDRVDNGPESANYDSKTGWEIRFRTTDDEHSKIVNSHSLLSDMMNASNMTHNKLKNISFQLFFSFWLLMVVHFLLKAFLINILTRVLVFIMMLETLLVFTALTFNDHKDFMVIMVIVFTLLNIVGEKLYQNKLSTRVTIDKSLR